MQWTQVYDPIGYWWASTLIAALPIIVLLGLLANTSAFGACVALFQAQSAAGERTPESAGLRHIAFMVERADLRLAQARLREHGVEFRFEDHGNVHSVYFSDPDGNVIELTTYDP